MAKSCNNCGYAYNANDATQCMVCDSPLRSEEDLPVLPVEHTERGSDIALPPSPTAATRSIPNRSEERAPGSIQQPFANERAQEAIEGRLSHLDRYDERPRTDAFKVMSGILIGIPVCIPFAILFLTLGIFSFAFAFIGFSSLSQLLNPVVWLTSSFELLEVMVLRRMGRKDTVPVYRGMVEDSNGRERAFVLRGPLTLGNLVVGHHVRLSGHFGRGTLIAREGSDLTTETAISSGYRNPWRIIFFVALFVDAAIAFGIFSYVIRMAG